MSPRKPAPPKDVVRIKRDTVTDVTDHLKTGGLVLLAGSAAGGTVYFFGDHLRALLGEGLLWLAAQIAALL